MLTTIGPKNPLHVGDKIWLSTKNIHATRPSKKLVYMFVDPFPVIKEVNPVAFWLQLAPSMNIHHVFHHSLLIPAWDWISVEDSDGHPPPVIVHDQEEFGLAGMPLPLPSPTETSSSKGGHWGQDGVMSGSDPSEGDWGLEGEQAAPAPPEIEGNPSQSAPEPGQQEPQDSLTKKDPLEGPSMAHAASTKQNPPPTPILTILLCPAAVVGITYSKH